MEEQLIICMGVVAFLISVLCFYICKLTFEFCRCYRQRNRIYPVVIQNIPPIELGPPSYEEVLRTTGAQASPHSNPPDNITSDNVSSDTQNREASGDNNSNNDVDETENSVESNIGVESGAILSLEENSDVDPSSKNKRHSKSNDDSGVKSGSGEDTVDTFDDDSKYDTASSHSAGVGDSRAPSP
ncbi:uncharacterized protein [Choristoneura fumiferana]|uniref:uncharacterized protein n=1 Tax=Choristoneura fumiferana TaxID=7141 RepID=UPI003D15B776